METVENKHIIILYCAPICKISSLYFICDFAIQWFLNSVVLLYFYPKRQMKKKQIDKFLCSRQKGRVTSFMDWVNYKDRKTYFTEILWITGIVNDIMVGNKLGAVKRSRIESFSACPILRVIIMMQLLVR